MDVRLWKAVDRRFGKSDIKGAVQFLEERLAKEKTARFKGLLGKGFTNKPAKVLSEINDFIDECSKEFAIKAVYLEMNEFDVNPDLWFFDCFGYDNYESDSDDMDWLSDWQSPDWSPVKLKGLEAVQADFKWYQAKEMWKDKTLKRAYDIAVLLVMCKFVALIESALAAGPRSKPIPVFATAHDFDIFGRFEA